MSEEQAKNYGIVDSENNLIVAALVNDSDYDSWVETSVRENESVYECGENDIAFLNVEAGCEYVPSLERWQPKNPLSDSWTKNGDGAWNEMVSRPTHVFTWWNDDTSRWEILDDEMEFAGPPTE